MKEKYISLFYPGYKQKDKDIILFYYSSLPISSTNLPRENSLVLNSSYSTHPTITYCHTRVRSDFFLYSLNRE